MNSNLSLHALLACIVWLSLGCGPNNTRQVGGRQVGGSTSDGTASQSANAPAPPQPIPGLLAAESPAQADQDGGGGQSTAEPPDRVDSPVDEPATRETAGLPRTVVAPARPAEAFSGDLEPHRVIGKFRTISDPALRGFPMEVDPETSNVDALELSMAEASSDSSRFLVDATGIVDSLLHHHLPVRNAVAGKPQDLQLPDGFTPFEAAGRTEDGYPWRIRCEADGALMALVPAGPARLGSDLGPEDCQPQLTVVLEGFYIDLHEVTVAQYKTYRNGENSDRKRLYDPSGNAKSNDAPVCGLMWIEARAYALWAGKELPTEAEWEKAARGPEGFNHPWGEGIPVWAQRRDPTAITPVARHPGDLSPYGLFDTAGNAREWVQDWYQPDYFRKLADESSGQHRNPQGPKSQGAAEKHVVKGGSAVWNLWARTGEVARQRLPDVGFRCVLRLKSSDKRRSSPR